MCDTSNITVGTIVMVKVGRNEIEVVVTEITANGWKVKKVGNDREFIVTRIERVIAEPGAPEAVPATEPETEAVDAEIPSEEAPATEPEAESAAPEAEEEVDTPNPAPESGGSPEKKLSLLNAALQVLKRSRTPLNTKEILAQPEWSKDSGAEPLLRILPRDQGEGDAARPQKCRPPGRIRVQQLTEAAGAEVGAGSASRSSSRAAYRGRSSWMYVPKCSFFTS